MVVASESMSALAYRYHRYTADTKKTFLPLVESTPSAVDGTGTQQRNGTVSGATLRRETVFVHTKKKNALRGLS
ncbi:hypothetical protein PISMIDRAFT_671732 [Pisolithus microcarpus 441]|uniref:Uncharacterized protein n=1 Tax=Pisolithus microcarpus 441 TaxID=765257 RepID=A0A0D0ACG7_9AGAM|nr:hypothetical protein PISMIDRAFT_671732 [Pisolithus microcarpus 441]